MPRLADTVICAPSMRYGAARCARILSATTTAPSLGGEIRQQDDELVPTVTTRGVGRTDAGDQALRHLLQQFVSDRMPECIVDVLEAVQIEEQQRYVLTVTLSQRHRKIEVVQQ